MDLEVKLAIYFIYDKDLVEYKMTQGDMRHLYCCMRVYFVLKFGA